MINVTITTNSIAEISSNNFSDIVEWINEFEIFKLNTDRNLVFKNQADIIYIKASDLCANFKSEISNELENELLDCVNEGELLYSNFETKLNRAIQILDEISPRNISISLSKSETVFNTDAKQIISLKERIELLLEHAPEINTAIITTKYNENPILLSSEFNGQTALQIIRELPESIKEFENLFINKDDFKGIETTDIFKQFIQTKYVGDNLLQLLDIKNKSPIDYWMSQRDNFLKSAIIFNPVYNTDLLNKLITELKKTTKITSINDCLERSYCMDDKGYLIETNVSLFEPQLFVPKKEYSKIFQEFKEKYLTQTISTTDKTIQKTKLNYEIC